MTTTGYRAVLAHPVARALFVSQSTSSLGDWIGLAALVVLAYERSGSVLGSAALFAIQGTTALVATVAVGPHLDRVDRRIGLVAAYLSGAVGLVVPLLFGGTAAVLVAAVVVGLTRPLGAALRHATAGALLPPHLLGGAVALQATAGYVFAAAGLVAGGVAAVSVGPAVALVLDVGTFLVAAALVAKVPSGRPAPRERPAYLDGYRAWSDEAPARTMVAVLVAGASVGALPETVAPVVAGDSAWLPLVLAGQSIGTGLGAFVVGSRGSFETPRWLFRLTASAAVTLVGAAAAAGWHAAALAVANVLFGAAFAFTVLAQTVFTRTVDRDRLGAATASAITLVMAAEGLGSLVLGGLAAGAGVPAAYLAAGAVLALTGVAVLRQEDRLGRAMLSIGADDAT